MRNLLVLTILVLFSSCSLQKRLYNKGFYISTNKNIKKRDIKDTTEQAPLLSTIRQIKKEINAPLLAFAAIEILNKKTSRRTPKLNKEIKFVELTHIVLEGDSVLKQKSTESSARKLEKSSFTLGLISLISTILFIFYITIPIAIICGIIAIRKGRKAIVLMGNDTELNEQYRSKTIKGIKLGISFFIFLLTLIHIALLVGIFYLALYGFLYFVSISNLVFPPLIICTVLGLCAVFGVVMLYHFLLKKILKLIPSKKPPI